MNERIDTMIQRADLANDEDGQTAALHIVCEYGRGLHYESRRWRKIAAAAEVIGWESHWPVVDIRGHLTGEVVETDQCDGYANVYDLAMVSTDELSHYDPETGYTDEVHGRPGPMGRAKS